MTKLFSGLIWCSTFFCFFVKAIPNTIVDTWEFNSQLGEDLTVLNEFFITKDNEAMTGGVFVEIGALDGVMFSNTRVFERFLGWTGVLIEGCQSYAPSLAANRSASTIKINKAVCPASTFPRFVNFSSNCGPSSGVKDKVVHGDIYMRASHGANMPTELVPCAPMSEMLRQSKVTHIDFFSIDVEGFELPLLQSINWAEVTVGVMIIEVNHNTPAELKQIRSLLTRNGMVSHGLAGGDYGDEIWHNKNLHVISGGKLRPSKKVNLNNNNVSWVPVTWNNRAALAHKDWRLLPCGNVTSVNADKLIYRDKTGLSEGFFEYVQSFNSTSQTCKEYHNSMNRLHHGHDSLRSQQKQPPGGGKK